MKLLGAREFIKMPTGTFYVSYWKNKESECLQLIERFKNNPEEFLDIQPDELHVFGDNSGSMSFSSDEEDYIFYYDANVVGDADPSATLYLVIEEDELPDEVPIGEIDNNIIKLSKADIIKIKNVFVNDVHTNHIDNWAFGVLDELSKSGNKIVDVNIG